MMDSNTFKLIEGVFNARDAQLLVLNFYNEKIMYHNRELLALRIKNIENTTHVEAKLESLQSEKDRFIAYLQTFKDDQTLFELKSSIQINPADSSTL